MLVLSEWIVCLVTIRLCNCKLLFFILDLLSFNFLLNSEDLFVCNFLLKDSFSDIFSYSYACNSIYDFSALIDVFSIFFNY